MLRSFCGVAPRVSNFCRYLASSGSAIAAGLSCQSSHFAAPIFLIWRTVAGVGPQVARRARCTAGSRESTVGGCLITGATGLGALPEAVVWYSTLAGARLDAAWPP